MQNNRYQVYSQVFINTHTNRNHTVFYVVDTDSFFVQNTIPYPPFFNIVSIPFIDYSDALIQANVLEEEHLKSQKKS